VCHLWGFLVFSVIHFGLGFSVSGGVRLLSDGIVRIATQADQVAM